MEIGNDFVISSEKPDTIVSVSSSEKNSNQSYSSCKPFNLSTAKSKAYFDSINQCRNFRHETIDNSFKARPMPE